MNNLLYKLERKFGRYYISNLMLYIVIGTGIVFVFQYLFANLPIVNYLYFYRPAILSGQVWRVLSFIFIPQSYNPFLMLMWLYFYWFVGSSLESCWGGFRFNVYYFTGVLFCIIAGFLTGFATVHYLNLSLFLALAAVSPNTQVLLFFFIPVKMKWLAWIDGLILLAEFINTSWGGRLLILLSVMNFLLFFGGDFFGRIKNKIVHRQFMNSFKNNKK